MELYNEEKKKERLVFLSTGNKGVKPSLGKKVFRRINR
jgi:hypothetical protein